MAAFSGTVTSWWTRPGPSPSVPAAAVAAGRVAGAVVGDPAGAAEAAGAGNANFGPGEPTRFPGVFLVV